MSSRREPSFRLQRRHTAHASRRDSLAKLRVCNIACGKDSLARCRRRPGSDADIAAIVQVQYALKQRRCWIVSDGHEYALPLSQGELASLIGATRETTSTTLNLLARRGLVRLGRRQLVLASLDGVRGAANERGAKAAAKA